MNPPRRSSSPPDLLCFVHIERAGGTTLHHILRNNYLTFLTLSPSLWTNDPSTVLTAADLSRLLRWLPITKGIGGHNTRTYLDYETVTHRPLRYFTLLRDPIDRYISHFLYQVHAKRIAWSLDSFLSEPRFTNFMTTRIAGSPDISRAKQFLADHFSFVGLADQFDESLLLMRRMLDLPHFDIRYVRRNESRDPLYAEKKSSIVENRDTLEMIRSQNLLDLELVDFAWNTLYPRYLDRYGPELGRDVEHLREQNASFHFSRTRRYVSASYRRLVYQSLEASSRRRRSVDVQEVEPSMSSRVVKLIQRGH